MPSENGALYEERSEAQNTHTTGHLPTLVATSPSDAKSDGRNRTRCIIIHRRFVLTRVALSRCALWDTVRGSCAGVCRAGAGLGFDELRPKTTANVDRLMRHAHVVSGVRPARRCVT
jgi:hypothetical protein